MSMPPVDKTFAGTMKDWLTRLTLVERRLAISGGGGGITTIQEGTGIDITGAGTGGDPMIVSLEPGVLMPALPDPVRYAPGTTHTPAATAWGTMLPGTAVQSITVVRPTWVLVTFGAWMISTAGETRAGISLGGATVVSPPSAQQGGVVGSGAWGQTLYASAADTSTASGQRAMQRVYLLNTGTTTFTIEAYIATAGTKGVNYPVLEITPLYYDDSPIPVAPTNGAITRRTLGPAQNFATSDTVITMNVAGVDSGHFAYNSTTGEFTCLVAGQYRITAGIGSGSVASETYFKVVIAVNGTFVSEALANRMTDGGRTVMGQASVALAVNDKITVLASSASGGAITANTARSFIELVPITDQPVGPIHTGPYAMAAGAAFFGSSSVAAGANVSVTINFPVGRFTQPPIITAMCANGRVTLAWGSVTTTSAVITGSNWSTGAMPGSQQVNWVAVQMTPDSSIG